ncbi:alpha/beta hydrolase [Gordonia sp. TBRC 11910]|uniref:Alpha/beta hydrolase n=1 Tax=Gordonia asplenii TaxID=2725283 RepID=A0A848KXB5_9ACTN|nr:alpha/beta hydrolase [Gordonia asplenii]NMO02737.1 alpha/beta hydrolase [Gordonia asplenii]
MTSTTETSITAPTRYVAAAGTRFAYRVFGAPTGIPLVFLHHFTATIDDWDPRVLDGIAAHRHVIVFDNRGVGGSRGRVPTTVGAMADDAVAFIRALGLTPVDLFGFSLGGFVAQVVALENPGLVRRIALAGTGPSGFKGVGTLNRRLVTDTALSAMRLRDPKPRLFFTRTRAGRDAALDYMARIGERQTDRVPRTTLRAAAAQLLAISRWGRRSPMDLSMFTGPALVANGEDDRMLATRGSIELAYRLNDARLVLYPDAGHGGVFQHHERFVAELSAFSR